MRRYQAPLGAAGIHDPVAARSPEAAAALLVGAFFLWDAGWWFATGNSPVAI